MLKQSFQFIFKIQRDRDLGQRDQEISPLLSNRFTDPRLTPDFSLSLFCEIFLLRRMLRMRAAISLSISFGVLDKN